MAAAIREQITEAQYLEDPLVMKMIRLAVSRARKMFDGYNDIDADSLAQDMFGEVGKSFYNPTKCKPGTFAYMVAWRRLRDISRKRSLELRHLDKSYAQNGVRSSSVDPDDATEGTDEELAETLRAIYATVVDQFQRNAMVSRHPKLSPIYLDRCQRVALHLFREQMGWNHRDAADALKARPRILLGIGVTHTPSYRSFYRIGVIVTHIKKSIEVRSRAPSFAA